MKVYINRSVVNGPYGGGNRLFEAFYKTNKFQIDKFVNSRVVLIVGIDSDEFHPDALTIIRHKLPNQKIILRVNECDARKNTFHVDPRLIELSGMVDHTIFVSGWLQGYFGERWRCLSNSVIINGVDKNIYKPNQKFNNGKTNIVCAHWSDNDLKGADYIAWLDEFVGKHPDLFTFTYIGRTKVKLKNSRHLGPFASKELGEELGKYDVCINASRHDPGPNSCIESISCGLPTYVHVDGGGGREFASNDYDHIFATFDDVEFILTSQNFEKNVFIPNDWETCINEYYRVFEKVTT